MVETPERISNEEVAALLQEGGKEPSVRPYDFAAQRINRTQLPLLEEISKHFAARAGGALTGLLGRDASMQFDSLDSVKSADLQASLPAPATLAIVRMKPLPGLAFVSVEPALLLTLLDGFFGGTGRPNADPQAAVAPAAQRFLALMLRSLAAELAAAWQPVSPMELELVKQETNPRLVQLGGALESVVVARFTVEFAARSGRIDWLMPDATLSPIREALTGDGSAAPVRKQEAWGPSLTHALQEAQLDTRAVLAEAQISLRELVRLVPGDIIPIEAPQQVTLLAGDVPLYSGRFGISQGHNALKILPGALA
ncbi:MAG TPA: FliM/FliN family flagellar motor switch protein [Steroidobacteraceae bacterium]|jgi:flagellar motor switch protein FliM|nr:FliM/FliN family flagellar motor switch protein [Steroidobacteraceae bacterium]